MLGFEKKDFEGFLDWLSDYGVSQMDEWDLEMKADSQEGGRLQPIIDKVRKDIYGNEGRARFPNEPHNV